MESDAIKNLFQRKVEIRTRDSMMAQHLTLNEEDKGGRLLVKEI